MQRLTELSIAASHPRTRDVCLAVHGSGTWIGPVLGPLGLKAGLTYGDVTRYLEAFGRDPV